MAGRSAVLTVRIVTNAQQAQQGAQQAASSYQAMGKDLEKLAVPAAIAAGAIVLAGKQAVDAASAQQQAFGAVESVYGDAADSVLAYANTAAKSLGLSKAAYSDYAAVIGAQLKGLGFTSEDAAQSSNNLIKMGADLAATFGGTTADAVQALSAALRGEADPAERYGLSLSQTRVNAELAARGLDKLEGNALTAAKAQVVMDLATQQAAGALGQFDRESDSAAGSAQIASASFMDAKASLGQSLLPAVTAVTIALTGLANWMGQNSTLVLIVAGAVGVLAGAILALNVAMKVAAVVTWAMNSALLASPITWITLAIVALVAIIVLIATKTTWFQDIWDAAWGAIRGAVTAVWNWISSNWPTIFTILTGPVGLAVRLIVSNLDNITGAAQAVWSFLTGAFTTVWDGLSSTAVRALNLLLSPIRAIESAFQGVINIIQKVIDWISKIKVPDAVISAIDKINPFSLVPAPAPAPAGYASIAPSSAGYPTMRGLGLSTRAPSARSAAAGQAGVTIVIQGALDPVAVARQVRGVLRDDTRRRGGVRIGHAT